MKTTAKTHVWGGIYEKIREREYLVKRQALLGLLRWDEIVHTDKLDNELILEVVTSKRPNRVLVNGCEYVSLLKPKK